MTRTQTTQTPGTINCTMADVEQFTARHPGFSIPIPKPDYITVCGGADENYVEDIYVMAIAQQDADTEGILREVILTATLPDGRMLAWRIRPDTQTLLFLPETGPAIAETEGIGLPVDLDALLLSLHTIASYMWHRHPLRNHEAPNPAVVAKALRLAAVSTASV